MDVKRVNHFLSLGALDQEGLFPHLEELARQRFRFRVDFGLAELPPKPGILLIRGARQYGKSTWLEGELKETAREFGPGSCFYLNGDELKDASALLEAVRELLPFYSTKARVRRLFIDEITAVSSWQKALKRLADGGELRDLLVVSTGSKASDLRRGGELLPGRKGKLDRTTYLFTPISYREFHKVCGDVLGVDTIDAYMLCGGSPLACAEIASTGRLPSYVGTIVRDWILGEFAAAGRSRAPLLAVIDNIQKFGGTPVGQAKLARESGLANNTVAAGYTELLADLLTLAFSHPWDASRRTRLVRRPCKYHWINLLVASTWQGVGSIAEYRALDSSHQGRFVEWLVAQELWRREAIAGGEVPEAMTHWASPKHEIDFVRSPDQFLEVKRGKSSPLDFTWFPKVFPEGRLDVIGSNRFEGRSVRGLTLEDFLLEE